jgi:hypothetical protein
LQPFANGRTISDEFAVFPSRAALELACKPVVGTSPHWMCLNISEVRRRTHARSGSFGVGISTHPIEFSCADVRSAFSAGL